MAILCLRLSTMPRLHTTSPLARSAGEGSGVRATPSAGEGSGVRATPSAGAGPGVRATPSAGEEGGDQRSSGNPVPASFNDAASIHHITPLPQRGRGAGGEGRPHLPPCPLPLPRCGRGRGKGGR